MSLTRTVEMALVLLLLCSGLSHFTFAANRLRVFSLDRQEEKTWNKALPCIEKNETVVTLYDEEDAQFTAKYVNETAWLGLHKVGNKTKTWSDGVPVGFSNSSVTLTNGEQQCEAIDNNTWKGFNCSEMKPFMCYKGDKYTLIENKKSWCQALQYCRTHFTDLVSINSTTQNADVIKEGKNTSFWIGLLHDEWEWQDKSCSSFRKWAVSQEDPPEPKECTATKVSTQLYEHGCDNEEHQFCSKGDTRIRVIDLYLTWEQAYDYCKAHHTQLLWIEDAEDQRAVEEWLNYSNFTGLFWIGLRQSRVFGFWIWSDRIVNYSNWKNRVQPELQLSNQCGVIDKADYKWSDANCLLSLRFLCEEEIVFMNKSMRG